MKSVIAYVVQFYGTYNWDNNLNTKISAWMVLDTISRISGLQYPPITLFRIPYSYKN